MLFPQNGKRAGLYYRLSRDELAGRESNSITNQRMILSEYAAKNGFTVVDEFADDGVSGTTFERPQFQRMMEEIKAEHIDTVIVKALSCLGRDYLGTGDHIEKIFPKLGVRFISIYEGYDSFIDSSGKGGQRTAAQALLPLQGDRKDAGRDVDGSRRDARGYRHPGGVGQGAGEADGPQTV